MKYELRNKNIGEKYLCEKVTIGGFDYYIIQSWTADDNVKNILNFWIITRNDTVGNINSTDSASLLKGNKGLVIATTNPNIDAPKVIDEIEALALTYFNNEDQKRIDDINFKGQRVGMPISSKEVSAKMDGFIDGYNKHAETHPNSEEGMVEFADFCASYNLRHGETHTEELLDIFKSKQPKVVYFA